MSALPRKRTSTDATRMSALCQSRLNALQQKSIPTRSPRRRATSNAVVTVRPSAFAILRLRMSSAFVDCMPGKSSGFFALENPAGIDPDLVVTLLQVRAVAHQASGLGEFAPGVDRGKVITGGERDEELALSREQCVGVDEQRVQIGRASCRERGEEEEGVGR